MYFLHLVLLLVPLATALQSIYLGTDSSSGQQGTYIAFFSDSDPCQSGTRFGFLPAGFDNCNQDLTILGHANITFTGCKPYNYTVGYPGSLPTGVSDGGAPALKCVKKSDPTSYPFASCEPDVSGDNVGFVQLVEYCS
ncbi:hypothetical protein MMC28_004390 [Mycoblastus sanguinarius]|nr:hypothetical protein [Mycoblastus sanguinarius]